MRYLLDAHTLIWFLEDDEKLSRRARSEIKNIRNQCFVSIAVLWEIAIKVSLGKLQLRAEFNKIHEFLHETSIEILPLELEHLEVLLHLDFHHRDPFDRIIIAQAESEDLIVISKDSFFSKYSQVKSLW